MNICFYPRVVLALKIAIVNDCMCFMCQYLDHFKSNIKVTILNGAEEQ